MAAKHSSIFLSEPIQRWAESEFEHVLDANSPVGIKDISPTAIHVLIHRDLMLVESQQTAAMVELTEAIGRLTGVKPLRPIDRIRREGGWFTTALVGFVWFLQAAGIIPPVSL